ncbi:RAQPRD family integrative conjugative element protein [Vibrio breoganii]|nr:RAQPRD family integrative conjugative element protein [Vibrio breoganii]
MRKKGSKFGMLSLATAVALVLPAVVSAGVWEERALLERYVSQLDRMNETLLVQAEASADTSARLQMDYEALRGDVELISAKIKHYLETPQRDFSRGAGDGSK